MKVPLLDLAAQTAPMQAELEAAVVRVLRDGRWVLGPEVSQLETELAGYLGVKQVIGCASGSDALLLALMALEVGPGDEVITTPFTFFATVSAITRLGARPVLVDIDPDTFNWQESAVKARLTTRTKAVLPVHLFGQCAPLGSVLELGVPVVEDACQAIGAKLQVPGRGWQAAGALGSIGTFSFYPTKNLGGPGDGGALSTNDEALAAKLRKLRNHGMDPRYYHGLVGINSRLDSIQAAVLRVKLPHLDGWAAGRRRNAALYNELLGDLPDVVTPRSDLDAVGTAERSSFHVFNQYTIRVRSPRPGQAGNLNLRDRVRDRLQQAGIGTEIYYPVPLHMQECFRGLGYRLGDFPVAEQAAQEVLSLPIYPELSPEQVRHVAQTLRQILAQI